MILRILIYALIILNIFTVHNFSQISFNEPVGPEGSDIGSFASSSSGFIFAGGRNIYRSSDNGASWTILAENMNVNCMAVNQQGHVFTGRLVLYRSTDNGASWTALGAGINGYISAIKISFDGKIYVCSEYGLYKSTNNGVNFSRLETGAPVNDVIINQDGSIFAATNGGMYLSYDNGKSFTIPEFGVFMNVKSISKNHQGTYFATTGEGIFRSDDSCKSWTKLLNKFDSKSIIIPDGTNIYVTTDISGILKSSDNGINWNAVNNGLVSKNILAIYSDSTTIFAGSPGGINKTVNKGLSWTTQNNGLGFLRVRNFSIGADKSYYAATEGGIFHSSDEGATWNSLNNNLDNTDTYAIQISPNGTMFLSNSWKLYRSTNKGLSWESMTENGLRDSWTGWFFFDTANTLYIVNSDGLYRTTNNGNSWQLVFNVPGANPFPFHSDSLGTIYAIRFGGISISKDQGSSWEELSRNFGDPSDIAINSAEHFFVADGYSGAKRSIDRGKTFTNVFLPDNNSRCRQVTINSNGFIFVADDMNAEISYSSDNGKTWKFGISLKQQIPNMFTILDFFADKQDYLYVVSDMNGIFRSKTPSLSNKAPNFFVQERFDLGRQRISVDHDTTLAFFNLGADTVKVSSILQQQGAFRFYDSVFTIAPHSTYKAGLKFKLPKLGSTSSSFIISHNSGGLKDTFFVDAFGYGIPVMKLEPDTLNFGTVDYFSPKDSTITLKNTGDDTLKIFSVEFDNNSFSLKNYSNAILPGEQVTDTIMFSARDTGFVSTRMIFSSNTVNQKDTVYLTVYCRAVPILYLSRQAIIFGEVKVGEQRSDILTISNLGTAPLDISSISISDSSFMVSQDSFNIAPYNYQIVTFTYKPDAAGKDSAIVLVKNNSNIPVDTLYLYGTGVGLLSVSEKYFKGDKYELAQNFPNPFNPETEIAYFIPEDGFVNIIVYNVMGEEVTTLVNEYLKRGIHKVSFDAHNLVSGVYFYRIKVNNFIASKKMTLLR